MNQQLTFRCTSIGPQATCHRSQPGRQLQVMLLAQCKTRLTFFVTGPTFGIRRRHAAFILRQLRGPRNFRLFPGGLNTGNPVASCTIGLHHEPATHINSIP